jgi:hypothetical protein
MIAGNPAITIKSYHSLDEIPQILTDFFANLP